MAATSTIGVQIRGGEETIEPPSAAILISVQNNGHAAAIMAGVGGGENQTCFSKLVDLQAEIARAAK